MVPALPLEPDLSHADPEVTAAVRSALEAVRAKPDDAAARGHLGMVLLAHDFDRETVAAFQSAEALDPSDYRWPYLLGMALVRFNPEEGLACLRRGAEKAPPARPEPRLRLAEELFERGETGEAERIVDEILAFRSNEPRASLLKARLEAARGNWRHALERTEVCKDNPSCRKRVALLRGECLARSGETAAAQVELRATEEMPGEVRWPDPVVDQVEKLKTGTLARISYARLLFEQGEHEDAIHILRETIAQSPGDPEPRILLGQLLIRSDPTAARELMTEHTTRFPDSVEGWFQLGVCRFLLDDPKAAVEAFQKTVSLKPDHTLAHHNLGLCHLKLGDKVAARAAFQKALLCRPDHKPTLKAMQELDAGK
jgi:tetratricopeptide (TPR) repeat protein